MSTLTCSADNAAELPPPPQLAKTGERYTPKSEDSATARDTSRVGAPTRTSTRPFISFAQQRMIDGCVSMAVATPAIPCIAPPSTAAYSSAGGVWLMSRGIWGGGLHGARRDAGGMNKAGGGYSNYPTGWDYNSGLYKEPMIAADSVRGAKTCSDEFTPVLESARKMHYRSPSTSTASSDSLKTEQVVNERSPWAWQWASVDAYRK